MTSRNSLLFTLAAGAVALQLLAGAADRGWPAAVELALGRAGTNRVELEAALGVVPAAQRESLQFLVEHMPDGDLRTLSATFLLDHVALAEEALANAPWRESIPRAIFLNDILPYASVNEPREAWGRIVREICVDLVKDCRTPGEAAQRLNERLFPLVKVKYSTQRRRPDQGPLETLESGLASCTGLSILLIDACRSVGVPARLVGTPNWVDKRGNHTWVEVWDQDWHFLGAAEPDPAGLDRGWFVGDASRALRDSRVHAIFASSFRRTGLTFPLVWARRSEEVPAINVTDRYTRKAATPEPEKTRLLVAVRESVGKQRVTAAVRLLDPTDPDFRAEGVSRDEGADTNDVLEFAVLRQRAYLIEAQFEGRQARLPFEGTTSATALITLELEAVSAPPEPTPTSPPPVAPAPSPVPPAPVAVLPAPVEALPAPAAPVPLKTRLSAGQVKALRTALAGYFAASPEKQATWIFPASLDRRLTRDEAAVRQLAWEAYRDAPIHEALAADFGQREVRFESHRSPYTLKAVGARPEGGWPLFIAMHGGGNAPARVNDQQWRVMQNYYRDQDSVTGYLYVALRAPNDTWNGFYDNYVYPLVANLIRQMVLFADVDPDKVFLMGYSHGGYGAFAIGPKMPDRFAAVHASAAAPTDGETTPRTLRNTVFTFMIGEKDLAYGRLTRCQAFDEAIQKLRGGRTHLYPVTMEFIAGNGHTGLPDRDKIRSMYPAVRNPVPFELTWTLTDPVIRHFYWLEVPEPGKQMEVDAVIRENRVTVTAKGVAAANVLLDSRLVNLGRPVIFEVNGLQTSRRLRPSLRILCETLVERGDPELAFSVKVPLDL
ncbi:MAG: transglutaminase domain-containing protein [Limisphaerales bacterium]